MWQWIEGFYLPPPGREVLSFVLKILQNPRDETTRLVLADRLEDTGLEGSGGAARRLRLKRGDWSIGGAVGRRHFGLTWWADWRQDEGFNNDSSGTMIAYLGRRKMPRCAACEKVPEYTNSCVLSPTEYFPDIPWLCFPCRFENK